MTNDMTKGSPFKLFIWFSIPLLIGNIFQQLYSMVDTIIVGRFVGVEALAAVGSTNSLLFVLNGIIIGMTSGFSVLVSQKFGAKDFDGVKKAISSNIKLTLIITLIITVLVLVTKDFVLNLMNTPSNIYNDASAYIEVMYAGMIAQVIYNMAAGVLRALGDSKTPLYFLIIASFLNIVLDLIFIINFNMGVAGAALATVISQGVSAILCIIYSYKKFEIVRLKKEDFNVNSDYYKTHLKIGVPMALQFSITGLGIMIVQSALNIFGANTIAAYTSASKVFQLVLQPSITFSITMASFTGQNLGAKNYNRIKEGVTIMTKISIVTSIISGIALVVFGEPFVKIFIENPTPIILKEAQMVLNYSAMFFIPLGLIGVYRNALQGMGESFVAMMAGVYELIARAIVAFTLPSIIGFTGICLADPCAWLAAAIPLGIAYYKKINVLTSENEELKAA